MATKKYVTEEEYLRANKALNEIGGEQQTNFNRQKIRDILSETNAQASPEDAGMILYYRTVKEHPFRGANRRTAAMVTGALLQRNGIEVRYPGTNALQTLNQRIRDGRITKEEFDKIYNERFLNRTLVHA